jgi:hypothetical protein
MQEIKQTTGTAVTYNLILGSVDFWTTSKYHGVCWYNKKKKWKASIHLNKKDVYLGIYTLEEEAAYAVNVFFEIFGNKHHTIINYVNLGYIQSENIKSNIIERMITKGYLKSH